METKKINTIIVVCVLLGILTAAHAQPVNDITAINPNSITQGTTGQTITFTLGTGNPPAPPAGVLPTAVSIGGIQGSSFDHPSQYTVTAVFDFPADEAPGSKDASISFFTPQGHTLTFSLAAGFILSAAGDVAPTITQHPRSISVVEGGKATFSVQAWGTDPLNYQWYKDGIPIVGADQASYSIATVIPEDVGTYDCIVTNDFGAAASEKATLTSWTASESVGYPIVDTGQVDCYDDSVTINAPLAGEAFYGQDAQHQGNPMSYTLSADGLTVNDNITGLTWTQSPDWNGDGTINSSDKFVFEDFLTYADTLNAQNYGGYSDWHAPTIKELYSLIDFRGTDPIVTGSDTSGLIPFINTDFFAFGFGDTAGGERIIDAQFWSSTEYVSTTMSDFDTTFGVNFADGRIKGYGRSDPAGRSMDQYALFVRGNPDYGINHFIDNGDGTITDQATGLMWAQDDSGAGMNWEDALAWVESRNAEAYLGHTNWRLPNAKELQSIVDYTRSPDTTSSAAIDPVFNITTITNETGQTDYPFHWTGTTHLRYGGQAGAAAYICFGRGLGSMDGTSVIDVHGAGCQRSDPKDGDPDDYPSWGHGPQGDMRRVFNYVRPVRDAQ